ncbi:hypothetical protein Moror_3774 [Moniliophthora roreri MCA 2997]|uniref:Yeast cell wall synthesis Kre9/Knh1-like N-terminal domain-containing protein n=1 Tax=Moniliophthora roreri (strain MCA 2997) TaxID=1381753 RepID=V2WVQ6_MONRO|nr:hypothetical protein Moror_3774 [Moniliophthora roreri MCA 2997]
MYFSIPALALAFIVALDAPLSVEAALYVIKPSDGSTCHAGEECTVQWVDNGESPLLSTIGVTTIGLYTGNMQLVQSIAAVDVSRQQSLTFTPIPEAGPDSDTYYIAFTSTTAEVNRTIYQGFSPFFKLDGMSGSFATPLEAATSQIPIPSSLAGSSLTESEAPLSTITVGTLSTSLPPLTINVPTSTSASPVSSGFSTMTIPPSSSSPVTRSSTEFRSTGTVASASTPTQSSNGALNGPVVSMPMMGVLSFCLLIIIPLV